MSFLTTAANNFKYSFRDQLLIYAQKPDATACAEISFWNKYGRWVNRGSKGIALLVDTDAPYKLRHVFDMTDTNSRAGRTIPVWQMQPEYESAVIESLENSYGEMPEKSDLTACLLQTAKVLTEDNFSDYYSDLCKVKDGSLLEELDDLNTEKWLKNLLENSIAYMLMTRCGINAREHFAKDDFTYIVDFNTPETISILGAAASDVAEMALREIAATVMEQQRHKDLQNDSLAKQEKVGYDEDRNPKQEGGPENGTDLSDRERLSAAEPDCAGSPGTGKVWDAAPQLSEGTSEWGLHRDDAVRQAGQPSDGSRQAGERDGGAADRTDGGAADRTDGGSAGRERSTESKRSNEVGGADEQHQSIGGGNSDAGADLQLNEKGPTGLTISHHDFNALSEIPYYHEDDEKNELLRTCDAFKGHRVQIAAFFAEHTDGKERGDFLKSFFGDTYVEMILSNEQRAGYHAWDDVLMLWRGAYLSREKEVYLRWRSVADTVYGIILLNTWLEHDEHVLPNEAEQIALIESREKNEPVPFTLPQTAIDYILCGGVMEQGKYRIFEQFQRGQSAQENIKFLKDEYGEGGHSDAIPGSGYWEDHDGKGITISRSYKMPKEKFFMPWAKVEKRIGELIKADRYLSQAEKDEYPQYLKEQEQSRDRREIAEEFRAIVKDYVDFKTQLGEKDQCADVLFAGRCADNFSMEEKKCYVLTREGSFVLPTMREAMQTIIKENTHLTERCETMLTALSGLLVAPLEPTYEELHPPRKEYRFSLGDTVYLGTQKYELLAFDEQMVQLYDETFPLDSREMTRAEFDRLLEQNPKNNHLLQVMESEPQEQKNNAPETQKYDIGYGYLGNGLTVWNRLEQEHSDCKTIAHIDPDRTVTFYEKDLPEEIQKQIQKVAATSQMTVSATQNTPVFSTPSRDPLAPAYTVGDTAYLENVGYRITDIGQRNVELLDRAQTYPVIRLENKEQFERMLLRDPRNEHITGYLPAHLQSADADVRDMLTNHLLTEQDKTRISDWLHAGADNKQLAEHLSTLLADRTQTATLETGETVDCFTSPTGMTIEIHDKFNTRRAMIWEAVTPLLRTLYQQELDGFSHEPVGAATGRVPDPDKDTAYDMEESPQWGIEEGDHSPWGAVQESRALVDGVYKVSTARHGGLMIREADAEKLFSP